jgi:peptidoglycan/LPS O-acetylase OafA/YrhL
MITNRIFGLDLLRAYAILSVLYGHAYELISRHISASSVFLYWIPIWDGVTLFFVLSGFLIGRILLLSFDKPNPGPNDIYNFWLRRWTRTVPPYYAALTATAILWICAGREPIPNLYEYYLFIQNWNWSHPSFFEEAWSLSIEEWFYLTVPIGFYFIFAFHRQGAAKAIFIYICTVIFLTFIYRAYVIHNIDISTFIAWDSNLRKIVTTRMDSLAIGVFGAYLCIYRNNSWDNNKYISAKIGVTLLVIDKLILFSAINTDIGQFYLNYVNLLMTPLAFLLFLPFCSTYDPHPRSPWRKQLKKCIVFVSTISYSLYLVNHTLVRELFFQSEIAATLFNNSADDINNAIIKYSLYYIVSFAVAYIFWYLIENPILVARNNQKHSISATKK